MEIDKNRLLDFSGVSIALIALDFCPRHDSHDAIIESGTSAGHVSPSTAGYSPVGMINSLLMPAFWTRCAHLLLEYLDVVRDHISSYEKEAADYDGLLWSSRTHC